MRTITVTSVFDAAPEAVWEKLSHLDTLMWICRPRASFSLISGDLADGGRWRPGVVYRFRLRLHGVVPMGIHEIVIESIDHEKMDIRSREHNKIVTTWDHLITLRRTDDGKTRYTDIVELYAAVFTRAAALWSRSFYRHRQRRWRRLLAGDTN